MDNRKTNLVFDWVLVDELAVGVAPTKKENIIFLKKKGISSILSLCSNEEARLHEDMDKNFKCEKFFLPDHKTSMAPTIEDLRSALNILNLLTKEGPVFVHCVASIERSPLLCMAFLKNNQGLTSREAYEYLVQVHSISNPLPSQLKLLDEIKN
tara:strand:- start:371 stop:832 length:462 start_codon:yes stop_codon:yes gene_type:complete